MLKFSLTASQQLNKIDNSATIILIQPGILYEIFKKPKNISTIQIYFLY